MKSVIISIAVLAACQKPTATTTASASASAPASTIAHTNVDPHAATKLPPGHPSLDASDPKELLKQLDAMQDKLKDRPKTVDILVAIGHLYYENGRYLDAIDTYRQAEELSAAGEKRLAELRAHVRSAATLPDDCRRTTERGYDALLAAAETRVKDRPAEALACAAEALRPVHLARARRGDAFYLIGNFDQARAEHEAVLTVDAANPESLFFLGAMDLEKAHGDKALIASGKRYWQRLLDVAPDSPRAALVRENLPKAETLFAAHAPKGPAPEEVQAIAEAAQNTPVEAGDLAAFSKILDDGEKLLDAGKFDEARSQFIRVLPFTRMRADLKSIAARAAADMGGAVRTTNPQMAERTLLTALTDDPESARANYELGRLRRDQGNPGEAAALFKKAAAKDPAFAHKSEK